MKHLFSCSAAYNLWIATTGDRAGFINRNRRLYRQYRCGVQIIEFFDALFVAPNANRSTVEPTLLTYVTQAWRKVGLPTFLFLSSRLAVAA